MLERVRGIEPPLRACLNRRSVPLARAQLLAWAVGVHRNQPALPLPAAVTAALDAAPLPCPAVSSGTLPKRIFAMLCRGELVVELPRARVDELVAAGAAMRFQPRRDGRLMKEWATLPEEQNHNWEPLAREALQFVSVAT